MKSAKNVDEYLARYPDEISAQLKKLRRLIKNAAPKSVERISYGMPFYEYGGSGYKGRLIYFAAFKKHISIFIPPVHQGYPSLLKKYQKSKSSFHFPFDKPIPFALIEKSVRKMVKEIDKENKIQ